MNEPRDLAKYRPCVGIVLFNADGKVFMGKRCDDMKQEAGRYPDSLQFPQGGIDEGEDALSAAFRELKEEIGTNKVEVLEEIGDWLYYDLPEEVRQNLPWGDAYAGQKQRWFAMRFTGTDGDIDLMAHDPQEFSSYRWIDLEESADYAVPFKRHIYEILIERFRGLAG